MSDFVFLLHGPTCILLHQKARIFNDEKNCRRRKAATTKLDYQEETYIKKSFTKSIY